MLISFLIWVFGFVRFCFGFRKGPGWKLMSMLLEEKLVRTLKRVKRLSDCGC